MKVFATLGALLGLMAVALGAFGAHALQERLSARGTLTTWETAVLYHLVHAAVLFTFAASPGNRAGWSRWAGTGWLVGIILFSGSLYVLALGGPRWLGPVTPFGGLALMAGWMAAGWGSWQERRSD